MKNIIQKNKNLIRSVIYKLTGSQNEDIEQEVYIKTWRNLSNYREEGRFKQWICTLTANVCRDYFRTKAFRTSNWETSDDELAEYPADTPSQEEIVDTQFRQKLILKAVDELPYKMRKVIVLYEFEDMSMEMIAKKTGVPVGTVKSRLFNARKILSQKLVCLRGE